MNSGQPILTLPDLLRHDVRHFADKQAITIDGRGLSYRQLQAFVDDVKQRMAPHVTKGDRVALWMPNTFTWVACFLAGIDLGAVIVPVNTRLTTAEVEVILKDAGTQLLITVDVYRGRFYGQEASDAFDGDSAPVTLLVPDDTLEEDWRVQKKPGMDAGSSGAELQNTFCIQYTSGTTSTPKGVLLTMASYLQTARHVAHCQTVSPSSQFISAAPFFHCSGSMHGLTVALIGGCTLHTMSIWDPEWFVDLVAQYRADVSHGVHFQDVIALGAERARPKLASLKVGYDISTPTQLRRLHDEFGITGISNLYGMTETSGQFTMWYPDDPLEKRVTGNGRPQPGNRIRLGDPETGAPLAGGEAGEIQMRGPTVARGYYNRPDATRQAFTADGWLRSGDLGRITEDGDLIYVARLKDIIRVGGENLAPAEVEQVLRDLCHPRQVSVVSIPDHRLGEVPVAVVVPYDPVSWDHVSDGLRARLAGFKIPRQIYIADELPMTATNKVQRANVLKMISEGSLKRVV